MRISVIIPAVNEAGYIEKAIGSAQGAGIIPPPFIPPPEIIVVDGGSMDGTPGIAEGLGAKVISSTRGRAAQMNAGAKAASGDVLLFLHADTTLPADYAFHVLNTLESRDIAAGAFMLKIDSQHPVLRVIERLANWRAHRLGLPYGDQAIFLTVKSFREIGGFRDMPIMEDFELMRRVRSVGKIALMPADVITSARRWERRGVLRTTLVNQAIILGYFMGVSPERLAGWR